MEACANSPSLPGLVAAYSADTCSDGLPSAPLSVMPTRRRFYAKGKMMGYSHRSLCGLTCPRLTATRGRALLRSYLADFHARIFRQPEKEQVSPAAAPASGKSLPGLLARFDHDTCSWKTPQSSLLADSTLFSVTWPRSGLMLAGACYRRPTLAPRTSGNGCGLWATPSATDGQRGGTITPQMTGQSLPQMINTPEKWPTQLATDGSHGGPNQKGGKGDLRLSSAVRSIPTPTVHGNYNRAGASPTSGDGLATFVSLFPTPTATNTKAVHMRWSDNGKPWEARSYLPTPTCNDAKNSTLPPSQEKRDGMAGYPMRNGESSGGQLNPDWVEWLMGWPIDWTSLEPLTTIRPHDWSVEPPDVPRVATGIPARVDRLKALGNGQVPQCAAEAWTQLHKRLTEDR